MPDIENNLFLSKLLVGAVGDGLTLAAAIKADRALAETRLIALASFGQAFSAAELKKADIKADLVKPNHAYLTAWPVSWARRWQKMPCSNQLTLPLPQLNSKLDLSLEKMRILLAENNRFNQQVASLTANSATGPMR